jgi:chromosome segregation protein
MAEVSLTLLNDNGSAPEELKDFTEINVTRRLYRSGESAYFINRQPCRLKDIHNIFLGSGMGTKTYAIIQQGNIGAITDAGPDERRLFIEEAAGVTRYKNRKKEAMQKVASTRQNLLRVNDIILEVDRQMKGLKRQARRAERYKKYKDLASKLTVSVGLHHYDDYAEKIQATDALLRQHKDSDLQQTTQLKRVDAIVEDIKLKRSKKDQEISQQKSQQFETQRKTDRMETELNHSRIEIQRLSKEVDDLISAKIDLEEKNKTIIEEIEQVEEENQSLARDKKTISDQLNSTYDAYQNIKDRLILLNEKLEADKASLMDMVAQEARYKNTYQNASNNKENLRRRQKRVDQDIHIARKAADKAESNELHLNEALSRLKKKIVLLNDQTKSIEEQLNEKIALLGQQVRNTQQIELKRSQIRSQYVTFKKMAESFAWYRDGVQSIMKLRQEQQDRHHAGLSKDIVGLMADILEPEPTYETAVEAVLGESLQYIIVQSQQAGIDAIDYLQTSGTGRSGFIPVPTVKAMTSPDMKRPDPSGRLLNHISVKAGFEDIANALLGHVVVADSMTDALKLFNANGKLQTIVTKDGNLVSHQGIFIGGSKEKLSGILLKKQEMRQLADQAESLDIELESSRSDQQVLEGEVRDLEDRLQKHIEEKNQVFQEEVEKEKLVYRASEERRHAQRHLEILQLEYEQLMGEESDIDEEIDKYNQAIAKIEDNVRAAQQAVSQSSEKINSVKLDSENINQKIVDHRLKLTSLNASLENSDHTLKRLKDFWQDGLKRLEQLSDDITTKRKKRASLKDKVALHEQQLVGLYENLKQLKHFLKENESDFLAIDEELKKNDEMIANIQSERERTHQKIRLLELEQSQRVIKQENIANRLEEQFHLPVPVLRKRYQESIQENAGDIQEMEAELEKMRNRMARIGDVNLSAIDEYEALKTRYDFLVEQRDDLEMAIDDLHHVIRKINKITQERFSKTFNAVNEKLKEVFPRLFEGGTAMLVLTDPSNPLETGVEFMIHPPGKKLTRMSLLSGGEKALSAIAFIFSIFLIKPTSFCLMDEIDAPLDDANVFRFNDLLKVIGEKSQIIMVTHNKRSMEFADTLFGITMGEKGVSRIVTVNFDRQSN